MDDEFAKVKSQLDDVADNSDGLQPVQMNASGASLPTKIFNAVSGKVGGMINAIKGGAAKTGASVVTAGSKVAAGGAAVVQSTSATSWIMVLCIALGLNFNSSQNPEILDDYLADDNYACLDEYEEVYRGLFGTVNKTDMQNQNQTMINRLKEINEWSKTYVAQQVPDRLVCTESKCPFYMHEGCEDGSHKLKKVKDLTYTWIDSGAQIDLANIRRIHSFFSAYGLTDVQIAAICGTMTMESRADFTSIEGYNIQGDRYNLDPSQSVTKDGKTYGFKPYAEGLTGTINTATCIHEIKASPYTGTDAPVDYTTYSNKYSAINKLGIGLIGFTDGDSFYNNTFLRNYADYLNDKVNLIQNIVEGSRGWREELRKRAADIYHIAYGAENNDIRGQTDAFKDNVDTNTFLYYNSHTSELPTDFEEWNNRIDPAAGDGKTKSSAYLYAKAAEEYTKKEEKLELAVAKYNQTADDYMDKYNQLVYGSWSYHTINTTGPGGSAYTYDPPCSTVEMTSPGGSDLAQITFMHHRLGVEYNKDLNGDGHGDGVKKWVTNYQDAYDPAKYPINQYMSICDAHFSSHEILLRECDRSLADEEEQPEPYIEYKPSPDPNPGAERRNNWDIVYPHAMKQESTDANGNDGTGRKDPKKDAMGNDMPDKTPGIKVTCKNTSTSPEPTPPTPPNPMDSKYYTYMYFPGMPPMPVFNTALWNADVNAYNIAYNQYLVDYANWLATSSSAAAKAEHAEIKKLMDELNALNEQLQKDWDAMIAARTEYIATMDELNKWAKIHAHDVVKFYNALQDYYTASLFDMESKIRDASFIKTTIFDDTSFFTRAANEYEFNPVIDSTTTLKFREVFDKLTDTSSATPAMPKPAGDPDETFTTNHIMLYYELWQNYAKYATNLPQNGKYINWWTPEVQLLYMVGGNYNIKGDNKGLKVRDEYRTGASCSACGGSVPEYDTDTSKMIWDWMSSWKGENYTGRDITVATKNYYYDMVSGGFDDGTLKARTEYAYAYYYMFQYESPYQQSLNYAGIGGECADIMDEMIAEGRWQTNTSNTLSDTAMPHNDKWKKYQKNLNYTKLNQDGIITRQWEVDSSTTLSTSILRTLGEKQSRSRVNLLTDIWNGCRYINVIDNETISSSGLYLVDNPLIYQQSEKSEFYKMKYGDNAPEPISNLAHTVYDTINIRLDKNGKSKMTGSDITGNNGFDFVKTNILWSGLDIEFEEIKDLDEMKEYLKEATSSLWRDDEDYQTDSDTEKKVGRGNSKIWEQRRLGPYYDKSGKVYYRYKWYLVPRVLDDSEKTGPTKYYKWYDDMRNDPDAERNFGDTDEDYDKYYTDHMVDEHFTTNTPSKQKPPAPSTQAPQDVDGYKRKVNQTNKKMADWVRVDWECWDPECTCKGKGGHGDYKKLAPGDVIISPDNKVYIWFGTQEVEAMFPLEKDAGSSTTPTAFEDKLVMAGGEKATKLKSVKDTKFEWSKPCASYTNHDTPCTAHVAVAVLPTDPTTDHTGFCEPYDAEGKWTVYRLITTNYTDTYRSAGVILDPLQMGDEEWETWYKYKYKGMSTYQDDRTYLEQVRKRLGSDYIINTNYDRDGRYM